MDQKSQKFKRGISNIFGEFGECKGGLSLIQTGVPFLTAVTKLGTFFKIAQKLHPFVKFLTIFNLWLLWAVFDNFWCENIYNTPVEQIS